MILKSFVEVVSDLKKNLYIVISDVKYPLREINGNYIDLDADKKNKEDFEAKKKASYNKMLDLKIHKINSKINQLQNSVFQSMKFKL